MAKPTSSQTSDPTTEREEVLSILAETIRDVHDEVEARDPEEIDAEKLHIRWVRTLGYLSGQYRKLMKDTDIDEMEEDLQFLETVAGISEDEP